jgi:hypothetical protein
MDPSATVDHFSAIGSSRVHMSLFVKTLATYDYIFTHDFVAGHIRGGDSKDLCAQLSKTFVYPAIGFAAYHPDMILIHDLSRTHGFLFGPIGPYHSAIGLFAYRKGLSLEECNALFNENVFDALGYFNVWNDSASELINSIKYLTISMMSCFVNTRDISSAPIFNFLLIRLIFESIIIIFPKKKIFKKNSYWSKINFLF